MDEQKIKLSDEELCSLSKSGDSEATEILILRYKNLVKMVTRSYFLIGSDVDDILQEGMIGLIKAIDKFEPKSSFKSFATLCIKRNVYTEIKKSTRDKRKLLDNCISLSGIIGDDEAEMEIKGSVVDPEADYIKKESAEEFKEKIKSLLSDMEFKILTDYLKGYSYAEIAKRTQKEVKSIDNALSRVKKKLEKALN